MIKTKVSYEITSFADERKVSECKCDTVNDLYIEIEALKYHYEHNGNFDSIRIITYVNNEPISEEWSHM